MVGLVFFFPKKIRKFFFTPFDYNMAICICTGAYRTSPIDSLYVDSGIPPLSIRREELGLRYMAKTLALKENPNFNYLRQPIDRSPTRPRLPKPLEVRLENSAREVGLLPACIKQILTPKHPAWCRPTIRVCPAREVTKRIVQSKSSNQFFRPFIYSFINF